MNRYQPSSVETAPKMLVRFDRDYYAPGAQVPMYRKGEYRDLHRGIALILQATGYATVGVNLPGRVI
jgi:hypothetical protein